MEYSTCPSCSVSGYSLYLSLSAPSLSVSAEDSSVRQSCITVSKSARYESRMDYIEFAKKELWPVYGDLFDASRGRKRPLWIDDSKTTSVSHFAVLVAEREVLGAAGASTSSKHPRAAGPAHVIRPPSAILSRERGSIKCAIIPCVVASLKRVPLPDVSPSKGNTSCLQDEHSSPSP